MPDLQSTICGHNAPGQLQPTLTYGPVSCRQCGGLLYASSDASGAISAAYPGKQDAAHIAAVKLRHSR
jgi:hypothetical protein